MITIELKKLNLKIYNRIIYRAVVVNGKSMHIGKIVFANRNDRSFLGIRKHVLIKK